MALSLAQKPDRQEVLIGKNVKPVTLVRTMLLRDGVLRAAVYTTLQEADGTRFLQFDIVLGTWIEGATDHVTFGVRMGRAPGVDTADAVYSEAAEAWLPAPFWGRRLTPAEASSSPLATEMWEAVQVTVENSRDLLDWLPLIDLPSDETSATTAANPDTSTPQDAPSTPASSGLTTAVEHAATEQSTAVEESPTIVAPAQTEPTRPRQAPGLAAPAAAQAGKSVDCPATDPAVSEPGASQHSTEVATATSTTAAQNEAPGLPATGSPIELDYGDDIENTDSPDVPAPITEVIGDPSHLELGVPDVTKAIDFYTGLLNWNYENSQINTPTVPIGIHGGDKSAHFEPFFEVADLETSLMRLIMLGGQQLAPVQDSGSFGLWVECTDNQGVRFALRQPSSK